MARQEGYLFWWSWLKKIIFEPFGWVILFLIILWVPFLRVWWWVFLPILLVPQLKTIYFWWLNWDFDYAKMKWILLEIIPPKEVLVPLKAMEDVFNVVWPIYDTANPRDEWVGGELKQGPYWYSWEIVSTEGTIHFYIRCLQQHKVTFEMALYAHYPDIEISEAQDYVKLVPPTAPNDEWDVYGEDWDLQNADCFPIKTYEKFFEPQGERIAAEEKRIDPIIGLLEGMSKLGVGEHYWVQFITVPILKLEEPGIFKDAEKAINNLSKRPEKKDPTFWDELLHVFYHLVHGPEREGSGEGAKYSWLELGQTETGEREMVLTPGERDVITEVENKMKKPLFRTTIRGVYVAKRENWRSAHKIIFRSYASHFASTNLNALRFSTLTRPSVNFFMRKRRNFLRARRMFRNAVLRFPPLFPRRLSDDLNPILNSEEMATLYHFPLRTTGMVGPTMANVDSKKAGPPPNLPIE